MSNITDQFEKDMKEAADFAQSQEEVKKKKFTLEKKRVDLQYNEVKKSEEELKIAESIDLGTLTLNQIDRIRRDNAEYMESAQHCLQFICKTFDDIIPFFRKNTIVIGAPTGQGKSTIVANLAMSVMSQKHPMTKKGGRVLILSNEEDPGDLYNRVTSIIKGFSYTNHNSFTVEQKKILDETIPILAKDGRLTIIGNSHVDDSGNLITNLTNTVEGIKTIFENLIKNKQMFDVVIIDYYQNVNSSKDNPGLGPYQVQEKFCSYLDEIKNLYPAPIVVLTQMKKDDEDTPFDIRIRGAKMLATKATVFVEMETDHENHRTKCTVRKGRYVKGLGREFYIGYDRGKFVDYDVAFQTRVNALKERKQMDSLNRQLDKKPENKEGDKNGTNT